MNSKTERDYEKEIKVRSEKRAEKKMSPSKSIEHISQSLTRLEKNLSIQEKKHL